MYGEFLLLKVLNKFIQLDIFIVSVRFFPEGFGVTWWNFYETPFEEAFN